MKKIVFLMLFAGSMSTGKGQELYPYTEPASNMPAKSLAVKLSTMYGTFYGPLKQRYTPEVMAGFNKNLMMHVGTTISNMHTENLTWESVYAYGKYRFLSKDEVHKHFRMAAFAEGGYSRNEAAFDELSITGDVSGLQAGLIATELVNKFAASATASYIQSFAPKSEHDHYNPAEKAFSYSLSAGYLVLPLEYTSYDQTNFNVYAELLGQKALDKNAYFVDLAPSIQLIFKSTAKLNVGYRFELGGNALRNMDNSLMVSFEYLFLNALKKK
jgi:hypothetical protein